MSKLLDRSRVEIKLGSYGTAPATALSDTSLLPRTQDYRRYLGARMVPLDREDMVQRVPASQFHVSRKVDGEFTVLIFRDGEVATVNPGGTVRVGMPWQSEAAQRLSDAGVKQALVAGELYVDCAGQDRRPRVHDVVKFARQPRSEDELDRLRFAVFDLLELDDHTAGSPFRDTWERVHKLFGDGEAVHPVETVIANDAEAVARLFDRWVEKEGGEGIVARSDTAGWFKIKPRHTLDAAVIGFTESLDERQGMLHDLLLGIMRSDGTLQVLSRVGGGFSEDQRRELLCDLKDMVVASEYAEVNSDHVAYQMVRPDWVVEISCLDMVSQTTRGGPVNRMVLEWHEQNGSSEYRVVRRLPLAAVISPQFIRRREDKQSESEDIRIAQVTDVVDVPLADRNARQLKLPASEPLQRDVYTKTAKGKTMVRKFLVWKTNKETESDEFPAYVLHYTDFSPNRKTPLAREIRISSSLAQIQSLATEMIETNIKAGWQQVSTWTAATSDAPSASVEAALPPTKVARSASGKQKAPTRQKAATKQAASETPAKQKRAARKKKSG